MRTTPTLPLRLLPLALAAGFAHAADPEPTQLETIHVKGEGLTSTHRVNIKSLEESTATDLKKVLFNEPAISFGGGTGQSQWVNIRGMGQDQIDFKVDDTYSDTQIFHHNSRFQFDPELVKVVAVQKGTGQASAGIGATSGAIVAETVEARDLLRDGQQAGFKLNAGVSSNKGWSRGLAAYGEAAGFDGLVAANWINERDYRGGKHYRNLADDDKVLNSALGSRGLLAKAGYRFNEDNRLELSHRQEKYYGERALREEFDFSNVLLPNGEPNTANNDPRYRITTQNTTNLEFKGGDMGFVDKMQANVYRLENSREELGSTTEVLTHGANLNLDSALFERHTLKYGVNWRSQEGKPSANGSAAQNEQKKDYGVYLEGIWNLDPVTLTTGMRYDYFNLHTSGGQKASDGQLNPSLGLIYDVNDKLSFNAGLSYASRSPRLYEVAIANARNLVVQDDLKAERSRNAEIGFTYRPMEDLLLSGNYFRQTIYDVNDFTCISGTCGGRNATFDSGVTQYSNVGTLKNHGYELNAAFKHQGWTARAGVAYSKPKMDGEVTDNVTLATPMGRTWTAGLAYQFNQPNLEIGWKGRFVQNAGWGDASRGSGDTGANRPGYGVNDIYANWKPTGKDNLNVNFAVNNVFDKTYRSHSQRTGNNSLIEPGRDFRLAVNYRF